jgi:hypothetical protein
MHAPRHFQTLYPSRGDSFELVFVSCFFLVSGHALRLEGVRQHLSNMPVVRDCQIRQVNTQTTRAFLSGPDRF